MSNDMNVLLDNGMELYFDSELVKMELKGAKYIFTDAEGLVFELPSFRVIADGTNDFKKFFFQNNNVTTRGFDYAEFQAAVRKYGKLLAVMKE